MNLKAIVIGGLVATVLPFILAAGFVLIGLTNTIVMMRFSLFISMFIGSLIAGAKSIDKSNAWKNGACAIAVMEILYLFMMYLIDYYLIHEPLGIITVTPIFLLIGAIGGFIGGKIRREK